jgi:hypothetical protein
MLHANVTSVLWAILSILPTAICTNLVWSDLASQVLRMNGYQVLEANSGKEALQRCEQHPGPIHL